ncbi:P-loop containing nucleoside triphosphate hydrolase protein, partial [Parachaetomium inaequale]
KGIRRDFADEKIIIAAPSLMFLDVLGEALRRMLRSSVVIAEFNGTVDVIGRAEILRRFNGPSITPNVLLLSAQAGGVGLNIAGASQIILTEPFWSPGDESQLIGRADRMQQTRKVKVYKVFAPSSDIDAMIRSWSDEKTEVRDEWLLPLVVNDGVWCAPCYPHCQPRTNSCVGGDALEGDDAAGSEVH